MRRNNLHGRADAQQKKAERSAPACFASRAKPRHVTCVGDSRCVVHAHCRSSKWPPQLTKFFPLNGPSGAISHFWISRALQSLSSTRPKMALDASSAVMELPSSLPVPITQA
eukprot:GHRQ01023694.1.p1 GENE.GHRQ01023694.1~~GHRQ01023694.1.p1  ORF type:complete len:112 (+),score=13.64 GHRQ01023694.1:48-383(+)